MENLKVYFSSEHDLHRILLLTASIFIFWNIENMISINLNYRKWKHALTNSLFVFTAVPVQFLLGIIIVKTIHWESINHFGLFYLLPGSLNVWLQLILAFILLDFFEYVYHVIMHKVKRLWMFHLVHHSDSVVNVSTTLREHPGETLIRLSFSALWVFLLGAPFWVVLFHQFVQIASNVFVHSNFRLPKKLDKYAGLIFITPNLHHVHHHYQQPYTDSNYGDILSIWDRFFGTFRRLNTHETIFGIDSYMDTKESSNFKNLIHIPFGEYRPPKTMNP